MTNPKLRDALAERLFKELDPLVVKEDCMRLASRLLESMPGKKVREALMLLKTSHLRRFLPVTNAIALLEDALGEKR